MQTEAVVQGRIIGGEYRLVAPLGTGAMGVVYRAEQLDVEGHILREVALKTMRPELSGNPDFSRRFLREVRVAARLQNPHAVTVYDSGLDETTGQLYYAMEYVCGSTLQEILQRQGPLPAGRVVRIIAQICEALYEAHRPPEVIVHRDLKPANIFIEEREGQDWAKVGDFGIAKLLGEETGGLTHAGTSPGTPRYMAPEQWMGKEVDARADLYALGVMMYEMLTGRFPFDDAEGPLALMYQHLQQPPQPLPPSIPMGIRLEVERLLAKTPEERPASALIVRRALEAVVIGEEEQSTIILATEASAADAAGQADGGEVSGPAGNIKTDRATEATRASAVVHPLAEAPPVEGQSRRTSPWVSGAVGGLIVLLLAGGGLWFLSQRQTQEGWWETPAGKGSPETQGQHVPIAGQQEKQQEEIGTSLTLAARYGSTDIVQTLLAKGIDVNARDADGRTALMWAAESGSSDIVRLLLDRGADVKAADKDGKTALLWAASRSPDNFGLVHTLADGVQRLVAAGAEVNATDAEGRTALLWAARNGYVGIVRILLAKEATINTQDKAGNTALLWATTNDYLDVVRVLLAKDAAVDMQDVQGKTALMAAANAGYLDIARALLAKDVDINAKDTDGRTALMWAVNSGSPDIVQLLLAKGADVSMITKGGRDAVMVAALKGQAAILQVLLTKGVDINTTDKDGKTALMWAADQAQAESAQVLLAKGAAVNITDKEGKSALIWAAEQDPVDPDVERAVTDITQALLAKGADVHLKSDDGKTALLWAAYKRHPAVVQALLAKKAKVQVKDKAGNTALMLASSAGHTEIARLLREAGAQE